jgi:hypothetical protein
VTCQIVVLGSMYISDHNFKICFDVVKDEGHVVGSKDGLSEFDNLEK